MNKLPWTDIPVPDPQSVYSYRLADIEHPFEFFWAIDRKGEYAFRFKGLFPVERIADAPEMSGISVSGEELDGRSYFNLTLDGTENADLFLTLCRSLMKATEDVDPNNDIAALEIILTRLRRWQDLLKAGRNASLSTEGQIGLFGELLMLRDVFLTNLEPLEAVCCWTGPLGDEQDFGYSDSLVEVKTTRSTRDQTFQISSLPQLDTTSGHISLAFQTLGVFENDPPNGMSLNGMVKAVRELLGGNAAAISELETRLTLSKYSEDPLYDRLHFVPVSRRIFSVLGDFPRIEPSEVRSGVLKANYTIAVDACLKFEMTPDVAISRILKGTDSTQLNPIEVPPEELVRLDESTELEFKSSLRWSYKESKVDTALEFVIIKTVSALANTMGGSLVIGVDDQKNVLGLNKDYDTLRNQKGRDGFELHLFQILINALGASYCAQNVSVSFPLVEDKEICVVQVRRSKSLLPVEKVDRSGKKTKTFFVRTGNSSRELSATEIIAYDSSR
jgi:Putative  PD-(D/E)XK family member, (DUF4420)/Schlafen, AlbA_2